MLRRILALLPALHGLPATAAPAALALPLQPLRPPVARVLPQPIQQLAVATAGFSTATLLTLSSFAAPALARPFLYTGIAPYNGDYKTCASQAEAALRKLGFSRDLQKELNDKERYGLAYGYLEQEPLTAEIKCVQREGITIWAVAGLDDKLTFEKLKQLNEATW
jgi:hypothetical protein